MPTGKPQKYPQVPGLFSHFFWPLLGLWGLFSLLLLYTGSISLAELPVTIGYRWAWVALTCAFFGFLVCVLLARRLAFSFGKPLQQILGFMEELETNPTASFPDLEGPDAFHDLTRRLRFHYERSNDLNSQLRQEHGTLQGVIAGLGEGLLAMDSQDRVMYVNDRAISLLEIRQVDPRGNRIWELVRNRTLLEAYNRCRQTGAPVRLELLWNGPPERHLLCHISVLGQAEQEMTVIGIDDVTELRRLESLRQEFVANVSHELKTPLAVIKLCIETLQDGAIDDLEGRGQFLEQIAVQSNRLEALIYDMLALARVESGATTFDFQEINLAEAVQNCLAQMATKAQSRNQTLDWNCACPGEVLVWADEESIRQILDNLVDNAIKYTPKGGQIRVMVGMEGTKALLQVKDNGIGIPAADLPRIFERFYRVDRARSREMGGTGLGLSIVKHLAQAMNGSVEAQSQPDEGSTFIVRLPLSLTHPSRVRHSA